MTQESKTTLLPCPFCGSDKISIGYSQHNSANNVEFYYWACCENCGTLQSERDGKPDDREDAIAAWNTRQ